MTIILFLILCTFSFQTDHDERLRQYSIKLLAKGLIVNWTVDRDHQTRIRITSDTPTIQVMYPVIYFLSFKPIFKSKNNILLAPRRKLPPFSLRAGWIPPLPSAWLHVRKHPVGSPVTCACWPHACRRWRTLASILTNLVHLISFLE